MGYPVIVTGARLIIGLVTMGIAVPLVTLFFIEAYSFGSWLAVAIPSFFGWCLAEFTANVLARPRLDDCSPGKAIREWQPAGDPQPPDSTEP